MRRLRESCWFGRWRLQLKRGKGFVCLLYHVINISHLQCTCAGGHPVPSAHVQGDIPSPVHMCRGTSRPQCTCAGGHPVPSAHVQGDIPSPVHMCRGTSRPQYTCAGGHPVPSTHVQGDIPSPVHMCRGTSRPQYTCAGGHPVPSAHVQGDIPSPVHMCREHYRLYTQDVFGTFSPCPDTLKNLTTPPHTSCGLQMTCSLRSHISTT